METVQTINNRLKETYGKTIDGRPRFRIVWAADEREVRVGNFKEYYGHIFLRETNGAKVCPKYPFAGDCFVLEELKYAPCKEILNSENGTYEPIWVFRAKDNTPLYPVWPAVEFLIKATIDPESFGKSLEISPDRVTDSDENFAKEVEFFDNYLDNRFPELVVKMEMKEAVAFGGIKRKVN